MGVLLIGPTLGLRDIFFYQSVGAVVENENLGVFSECTHPAQAHWI